MKLTEALSGSLLAGAERGAGGCWAIIHQRCGGFHLTRYSPDGAGHTHAQTWLFPNLYDLLIFARQQGFAEVDPGCHRLAGGLRLHVSRFTSYACFQEPSLM